MGKKKEILLIIIILICVSMLEIITCNIENESINKVSNELDNIVNRIRNAIELRDNNNLDNDEKNDMAETIRNFKDFWISEQNKLSIFVEHDELEKVTESLIILEENSRNEEFEEALSNSAEFKYWLYHFEEKGKLKIKNIF